MAGKELLQELLEIPAPSGGEEEIQKKVFTEVKNICPDVTTDLHGNLIACVNREAELRVILAAHCDQIGFMVKYIDPDGFLFLDPVGGPDEGTLPGASVVVTTKSGPIPGVLGKRAVHLETKKQKDTVPTFNDIWVDIGAKDRQDAEKYVQLGDYVTFSPNVRWLKNGFISAPSLDNRAGLFVVLEVLRRFSQHARPDLGLFAASTVQEELGMRGAGTAAFGIKPQIAIAVDVTNASDDPGKKPKCPDVCLGKGPGISRGPNNNPRLHAAMVERARSSGIPFQVIPSADLEGNDSKTLQVAGGASAALSIGIPNRNMHTPAEVCHWDDLQNTIQLLVDFLCWVEPKFDLRPLPQMNPKGGEIYGREQKAGAQA